MMQLAVYRGPSSKASLRFHIAHLAICIRTFSRYSHCELVIDGVCWSSSVMDGGVRSKLINLQSGRWDVFDLDETRFDKEAALRYLQARLGWRYSWWGILRFILPFVKQRPNEAFCSQIVAGALGVEHPEDYHVQRLVSDIY